MNGLVWSPVTHGWGAREGRGKGPGRSGGQAAAAGGGFPPLGRKCQTCGQACRATGQGPNSRSDPGHPDVQEHLTRHLFPRSRKMERGPAGGPRGSSLPSQSLGRLLRAAATGHGPSSAEKRAPQGTRRSDTATKAPHSPKLRERRNSRC